MVLIYSADAIPPYFSVGLFDDAVQFRLHRLRVSVPEPCPASDVYHQNLGRALELISYIQCLCSWLCWYYRMFDILQQFFRVICCPCLKNRINYSQYLAGYYYQRLHLFQWIVGPCRIVLMQLFEFVCMHNCWLCSLKQPVSQPFASSMTDFCLSLVLTRTTCYKSHSA